MLNEYAYCPRLFHLMHIEGRWADNEYTVEGSDVHRRVDRVDSVLPLPDAGGEKRDESGPREEGSPADGDSEPTVVRSLPLSCDTLGLTGKLDLVAFDDSADPPTALPVESKRGRVPDTPDRSYEPERVQLMAQGLLLRAHGFECNRGVLYFAASRTRVDVPFTAELEARTRELLEEAHAATSSPAMPDPLEDSPKCVGCSLAPICLPDATLALRDAPPDPDAPSIR
ncbi:MAG: CRISPR-associated protein Cas4, partial [Phycisphaeraceae bacterium]